MKQRRTIMRTDSVKDCHVRRLINPLTTCRQNNTLQLSMQPNPTSRQVMICNLTTFPIYTLHFPISTINNIQRLTIV